MLDGGYAYLVCGFGCIFADVWVVCTGAVDVRTGSPASLSHLTLWQFHVAVADPLIFFFSV